ncbi:MAG TPA: hypothetical protein VN811_09470 [Thermoanaerobaculia bacterium]|nr:hypothetical protein [Thermoanaerobaculia bacterium]
MKNSAASVGDAPAGATWQPHRLLLAVVVGGVSFAAVLLTTLFADHYDDAFITYVFARNWAAGHGIVWVPGDRPLYAATSLTYTALLAAAARVGLDLPTTSSVLGALGWAAANGLLVVLLRHRLGALGAFGAGMLSAVSTLPARLSMGMESGVFAALVFLALTLQQEGRRTAASVAAAIATLTRPEGLLLFPLLAADALLRARGEPWRRRWRATALALAPGVTPLGVAAVALATYFGSFVPHSLRAKLGFGCEISGCFSLAGLAALLAPHAGVPYTYVLLTLAAAGGLLALAVPRHALLFAWTELALVAFIAGHAPNSPWYYAPLVPGLFAAAAAVVVLAGRRRWPLPALRAALLAALVAVNAFGTARLLRDDFLGRQTIWNGEKRELAAAVRADMARRGTKRAHVLAFEVGYLGYVVPGRVDDLLGIVSPGLQPCLRGEDGEAVLTKLRPDYVVLVDNPHYLGTGCIQRTAALARDYVPIHSLTRQFGDHYVVHARRRVPH